MIETSDWIWDLTIDTISVSKRPPLQDTVNPSIFKSQASEKLNSKVRLVAGLWNRVIESYVVSICE